jgi:hypothetical protein
MKVKFNSFDANFKPTTKKVITPEGGHTDYIKSEVGLMTEVWYNPSTSMVIGEIEPGTKDAWEEAIGTELVETK